MTEHESPLSGGNVSVVVRVGDTVRRTVGPWSAAVHSLLRHLEAVGFAGAPRFLGLDAQGREMLTFLPGEVGIYPLPLYMWADAALVSAARLLRRYHDATVGFTPPAGTVWQTMDPDPARHEVICHNDFAPYNLTYVDEQPTGIIDFDFAGPGPRLWDLAYAAYRCVPISYAADLAPLGLTDPASRRGGWGCSARPTAMWTPRPSSPGSIPGSRRSATPSVPRPTPGTPPSSARSRKATLPTTSKKSPPSASTAPPWNTH